MFAEVANVFTEYLVSSQPLVEFLRAAEKKSCGEKQERSGGQQRYENAYNSQGEGNESQGNEQVIFQRHELLNSKVLKRFQVAVSCGQRPHAQRGFHLDAEGHL